MNKVFSGDSNNLKSFSWLQSDKEAVNSSKKGKNIIKSKTRESKNLDIKKVLSTNEENLLEAMKIEKKEIEKNVKNELIKEIKNEKQNYQYFKASFDEMDKIKQDAYEKGFSEGLEKGTKYGENLGYKDGVERAKKEYYEKLQLFSKNLMLSIENIELFKNKILNNSKSDTLELAMIVAKKIINQEITLSPRALISIIENSLEDIVAKNKLNIFLNKDDYELVKNEKITIVNAEKIVLTADSQLKRGEIKIESDLEQLSYSIDDNVDKLGNSIKNNL